MEKFDRTNKTHKAIVVSAMLAADQFGVGRVRSAKDALDLQDVIPYETNAEQDAFQSALFDWQLELRKDGF